ncbi:DUF721 domain-containing protein [candidate division WOR-3 bacterium]|nr:DUF721 domain-containing protein [candidate division WOR-3 bacterium]
MTQKNSPGSPRRGRAGRKPLRRFQRLGSVLPRVVKGLKLQDAVAEQQVVAAWPECVGAKVAEHTRALYVERESLVVAVDSPAWMTELSFLRPQILAQLAKRTGPGLVRDLRFVPGRSRSSSP